jgi:hypothetical protein
MLASWAVAALYDEFIERAWWLPSCCDKLDELPLEIPRGTSSGKSDQLITPLLGRLRTFSIALLARCSPYDLKSSVKSSVLASQAHVKDDTGVAPHPEWPSMHHQRHEALWHHFQLFCTKADVCKCEENWLSHHISELSLNSINET